MRNYLDILQQIAEGSNEPLDILEIGCIRSVEPGYDEGDGHSTYHIAKWLKDNELPHRFTSIDINTAVCDGFLKEQGVRDAVTLIQVDSVQYLNGTKEKYDFIYLDSENDAERILAQFKLCLKRCKPGAVIVIDDCDFGSTIKLKGNLLIPYLRQKKIKHDITGIQVTVYVDMLQDYSDEIQGWYDFKELYAEMVARFPKGYFVEVGSWLGKSAVSMATMIHNAGQITIFECVDTWEKQDSTDGYPDIEDTYKVFCENIKPVDFYVHVKRMTSLEAAKQYPDNFLSFVFIDASHKYKDVCADIEAWLPKIKRGGVLAGHDWAWPEVSKAVSDKLTCFEIVGNSWVMNKPKVYDCFIYFNEAELLEIRLNELKNVVDCFVIVEARETFSGNKKPLNFDKKLLKQYPIKYLVVDLPEGSSWARETYQRNAIMQGLTDARDTDYIIISDVDEIPKAGVVSSFTGESARMLMNQYRWQYNNFEFSGWKHPIITRKRSMINPQHARIEQEAKGIENAGWHFTCVTDVDGIILKFNSFAHTEMQTVANRDYIKKILKENNSNGANEITLTPVELDSTFPEYLYKNKTKFKKFIL